MIPYAVTLIPTFLIFRWLGWVGTYNPLTLPALFGDAFSIFLLRQFYMTIPQELSEAARIDGASEYAIYGRIILQLAKPALATVHALYLYGQLERSAGAAHLSERQKNLYVGPRHEWLF